MDYILITGFIAATLTTCAFMPQALQAWKTKSTKDISLKMYAMSTAGIFLWLIYGILIFSWPLIIANIITFILAMAILVMKIRYG